MSIFRLSSNIPQRVRPRRIHLQGLGLADSDIRIFELILQRTVLSPEHRSSVQLSSSDIAAHSGIDRRSVIRSMNRLREKCLIVTVQNDKWFHRRASQVGLAPELLEEVRTGGKSGRAVTSAALESGLHNMDCFEGFRLIAAKSVQMVLTDLPTGATANDWDVGLDLDRFWKEVARILKPSGAVVIFAHFPFDKLLAMSNLKWLKHEWIWEKEQGSNFLNANSEPMRSHETILIFSNGTPTYRPQMAEGEPYKFRNRKTSKNYNSYRVAVVSTSGGSRFPKTVLRFDRERGTIHPTQKPVPLLEYLIRSYTSPGDLIHDPCAGSGSTGVAAMNTSRRFVGFEKDRAIFEMATKRLG